MKFQITAKIFGILLMFFSISMLTPIPVSLFYHDGEVMPFIVAFLITFCTGFLLWLYGRGSKAELRTRDGFLIVFLMWFVLGAFGALPFMLSHSHPLHWSDAFFECMSGLTTTGASAIKNIDILPKAILYYRQQLMFLGGMGIIVLAIAIMPLIGVGGMQLFKAETSGPVKDSKLTPRLAETAKMLWIIYVGLNIACALCYWAGGMSLFDAIGYAFATIATGGFAPHNASMAYYPSDFIQIIAMIFMFLGGTNFSLHFLAFRRGDWKCYFKDTEWKTYLGIVLIIGTVVSLGLLVTGTYHHSSSAFMKGFFQVISFMTTTGFTSTGAYAFWPLALPIIMLLFGLLGACAGSTSGGFKIVRGVLLKRQVSQEIKLLIHPNGVFPVKLNGKILPQRVLNGVWAFAAAYIFVFVAMLILLLATGENLVTAFSALATCIANVGPGLGKVASNFSTITPFARWVLTMAMLIGRLEIFTFLVLLSPTFWRA